MLYSIPEHLKYAHYTENVSITASATMTIDKHKNTSHRTTNMNNINEWLEEEGFGDEDLANLGL